jgi:hypothetical protein
MTTAASSPLFAADDAEQVRLELRSLNGGSLIDSLRVDLDAALRGSDDATRRYLRSYRQLTGCLLDEARKTWPDLIVDLDGDPTPTDAHGRPALVLLAALHNASAEAPFTAWSTRFDLGDAVALDLTSRVRALIGLAVLAPPAEPLRLDLDDLLAQRFVRRVRSHLNHPDDEPPLQRMMGFFELSKSDLGRLFGVRRQAIDGWLSHGVPAERQEKLGILLALADLLERKLKAGRAAGVARRPAEAYGGLTMLEMIAADRHRELLDSTRAAFDWSEAA